MYSTYKLFIYLLPFCSPWGFPRKVVEYTGQPMDSEYGRDHPLDNLRTEEKMQT